MHQIVYTSTSTNKFNAVDLVEIVQIAMRDNPARDITGFLLYNNGTFLQLIEGPKENLDALLEKLSHDPRHENITIVYDQPSAGRQFPNWRMKRLPHIASEATAALNEEASRSGQGSVPNCVSEFIERRAA